MNKKEKKDKKSTHGAYGKNHSAAKAWRVDADYLDRLSREDREWYAAFCDKSYAGDFRGEGGGEWSDEERRAAYIDNNVANSDLYTTFQPDESNYWRPVVAPFEVDDRDLDIPDDEDRDLSPTPEYLNSPEYKAALARFRAQLTPGRQPRNPERTPEFNEALEGLEIARRKGKDGDTER